MQASLLDAGRGAGCAARQFGPAGRVSAALDVWRDRSPDVTPMRGCDAGTWLRQSSPIVQTARKGSSRRAGGLSQVYAGGATQRKEGAWLSGWDDGHTTSYTPAAGALRAAGKPAGSAA